MLLKLPMPCTSWQHVLGPPTTDHITSQPKTPGSDVLYAHLCLAQPLRPPRQLLLAAMLSEFET